MARILIAEDDASVRDFAQRALERQGHVVTAVEDGYAALERLAEAAYDLIVSDVVMPGMDGIELALRVAQSWPEMPVLLMSAFDQEGLRSAGIDAPTGELLSKPFSLKRFCDAVEAVLGRDKKA